MATLQNEQAIMQEELREWAPFLAARLRSQLASRNISMSGALAMSTIATVVASNQVDLSFLRYGRFNDMGARRGGEKGQFTGRAQRGEKLRPPKPTKYYSRTAWGTLTTLINNIASSYVEQISSDIKHDLTNG